MTFYVCLMYANIYLRVYLETEVKDENGTANYKKTNTQKWDLIKIIYHLIISQVILISFFLLSLCC